MKNLRRQLQPPQDGPFDHQCTFAMATFYPPLSFDMLADQDKGTGMVELANPRDPFLSLFLGIGDILRLYNYYLFRPCQIYLGVHKSHCSDNALWT